MNHAPPNARIRVALAVVLRDQRWLVARRRPTAHLGDRWEFPGGRVNHKEAPVITALRELHEECGVLAAVDRPLPSITHAYPTRTVELLPFLCGWRAAEAVPFASVEVRWIGLRELRRLSMPAADEPILRALEFLYPG